MLFRSNPFDNLKAPQIPVEKVGDLKSYADEFKKYIGTDPNRAALEERLTKMDTKAAEEERIAPWMALAQAGFGMAAGKSPYALSNIGEGALAGVKSYGEAKDKLNQLEEKRFGLANDLAKAKRAETIAEAEYGAKDDKAPDVMPHADVRTGHIRFEIAEGNCMSAAGSIGKFFNYTGIPFFPAMTIYDFFIKRAHDQFYYNLYWHSAFATIGTPSGITLAPEGAQHSWKSDFQIPNCVTWEPCFAKELEWILADGLRRHFTKEDKNRESLLIRCVTKGLVQKELLDRLKKHKKFQEVSESDILEAEIGRAHV